jgi:hypothetical protein
VEDEARLERIVAKVEEMYLARIGRRHGPQARILGVPTVEVS